MMGRGFLTAGSRSSGEKFELFYRVEDLRSRDTGGTGLGLVIALAIVQAHGGDNVLANRPGGGLRARITLPI